MIPMVDRAGVIYWAGMILSGAFMMYHALRLAESASRLMASRVLHASVLYLPIVLGLMIAWKK
jgi:heme O synthase-like polyprenyltransferase